MAWEADLAARLAGEATATDPPVPDHDQTVAHDLDAALKPIDLRTMDLSPTRPRTGIERHLREALGIHRPTDPIDIPLPPLPGHGIDGPDLGR